jgi:hypothetical protein
METRALFSRSAKPSAGIHQKWPRARMLWRALPWLSVVWFMRANDQAHLHWLREERSKSQKRRTRPVSGGRVKEWRLGRRCGLSVAPRFLWECLTSPTVSWFSSPATSNRTCGSPAYGVPTTFGRRRSRTPPTSPRPIEVLDPTLSKPGIGMTDDDPLHTHQPPFYQAHPHVSLQGLQLLRGVTYASSGTMRPA